MPVHYPLSYQVTTVSFNGKYVTRLPDEAFVPVLRILKSVGVSEVMLSGYVTVEDADFDMDAETKRIGDLLGGMGMSPAHHHGLSALYAPLDRPQEPVIRNLIRSVRYTANLGAPALALHPCHYYAPDLWNRLSVTEVYERECEKHGEDAVIACAAANLRAAASAARELGVKIALENLDRFNPLSTPGILPRLVAEADSPEIGFCVDSGHAHCCGARSVTDWIRTAGSRLYTTHFHDNRGPRGAALTDAKWIEPEGIDEHNPPGFGTIPWVDVIKALRSTGYSRTVNFESVGWPYTDTGKGFAEAVEYWRTCEEMADRELRGGI